jgi:hypothetical protein
VIAGDRDLLLGAVAATTTLVIRWLLGRQRTQSQLVVEVFCGSCGRLLREPPDLLAASRPPCPVCESRAREKTVLPMRP